MIVMRLLASLGSGGVPEAAASGLARCLLAKLVVLFNYLLKCALTRRGDASVVRLFSAL
jgi:hypothetical protein